MEFNSAPTSNEYHQFYGKYISLVDPDKLPDELTKQPGELKQLLSTLSDPEVDCLHEPYTWTLKQVIGHLIDCERIFSHRLNRIAVGDETPIPGIDQNKYVSAIDYSPIPMANLLDEFEHLRRANCLLYDRLPNASMTNMGIASTTPVSARANLFIFGWTRTIPFKNHQTSNQLVNQALQLSHHITESSAPDSLNHRSNIPNAIKLATTTSICQGINKTNPQHPNRPNQANPTGKIRSVESTRMAHKLVRA